MKRYIASAGIALLGVTATFAEPPPAAEEAPAAGDTVEGESAIDRRRAEERAIAASRFAITPHKPNYFLLSYNDRPNQSFEPLDDWEIKFQISLKVSLFHDVLGGDVQFGYTQQSYWQAFNKDLSSPFRETNYEPEIMWTFWREKGADEIRNRGIVLGFVHQSNGRSAPLSRSWNRVYVNFVFEYEDFYFSLKPWYRIPENEKSSPADPRGDDNPDIDDYLGHGEITAMWIRGKNRYGLMLRNNLDSPNRGAIQIDWSFPIKGNVQGYVQYFYGYGESLIDYNHRVNRLGVGLMLNNWL